MPHEGRKDSVGRLTREQLEAGVLRVEELLVPMKRLIDTIKRHGWQEPVEVRYIASLKTALKSLARWGEACETAITEEHDRRGLLGETHKAKKEKKPKEK